MNIETTMNPEPASNKKGSRTALIAGALLIVVAGAVFGGGFLYQRSQATSFFEAGTAALEQGNYLEAIDNFNRSRAILPDSVRQHDSEALVGRGLAHLGDENWQAAVDDLSEAIAADGNRLDLVEARARAYLALENWTAAIADLDTILAADNNRTDLLTERGRAYLALGDEPAGLADYATILSQDPSQQSLRLIRLESALQTGDVEAILAEANDFISADDSVAEPYLQRGLIYLDHRADFAALEAFDRALELEPDLWGGLTGRSQVHLFLGNYDNALADAEAALSASPNEPLATALKGAANIALDSLDSGIDDLNWAVANSRTVEDQQRAIYWRGWALLNAGLLDPALSDAMAAIALDESWPWTLVLAGDIRLAQGEGLDAFRYYTEALEQLPETEYSDRTPILAGRAAAYLQEGNLEAARNDALEVLASRPDNLRALLVRASVAAQTDDSDLALSTWAQALAIDTSLTDVYFQRAQVYLAREDWSEAQTDFERVLADMPANLDALRGHSQALLALGDEEAALVDLNQLIPLQPGDADLLSQRAEIYYNQGDLDSAYIDALATLDIDDDQFLPLLISGFWQLEQENYFQAIVDLTDALDIEDSAVAYAARAEANFNLDDIDRARADAGRAIQLDDELAQAYITRARVAFEERAYEEALVDIDRAVDIAPDDTEVYRIRGEIFLNLGDANTALDDFNRLIDLAPDEAEGYLLRASALDSLNRYDDAANALRDGLGLAQDVNDIELAESLLSEILLIPPSIDGQRTWTDILHGYAVSYPDDWRQFVDVGSESPLFISGPLDKDYRANVNLLVVDLGFPFSTDALSRSQGSSLSSLPGYDEISLRSTQLGGRSALQRTFSFVTADTRLRDIEVVVIQTYLVIDETAYLMTATARLEDLPKYQPIFDGIFSSFRFTN